ncbi:MAG: hypothetical protein U1E74_05195 [Paenacidovorax caeni]
MNAPQWTRATTGLCRFLPNCCAFCIPTLTGEYNPDFGYVVQRDGKSAGAVSGGGTKGYDQQSGIVAREKLKIDAAKRFFKALADSGVPVTFETKLNQEKLAELIEQLGQP